MARLRRTGSRFARGVSPSRLLVMAVVVWALIPAPLGASVAEPLSAKRIGQAAREVIAEGRYQRTLPNPPKVEEETRPSPSPRAARPFVPPRVTAPESTGEAARLVRWVVIAIAGVLLGVFMANELPRLLRRRSDREDARPDAAAAPDEDEPAPGGLLDEADRLAHDGAHGAAIHLMLLALVDALHGPGRRLARSLTGREIAATAGLAARPGEALSRIVAAAERSHFGDYVSSRADFEACRRDHAAVSAEIGDRA